MRKIRLFLGLAVVAMFALVACSSGQPANNVMADEVENTLNTMQEDMTDEMSDESSDEMMENETADSSHQTMEENQEAESPDATDEMAEESNSSSLVGYEFTNAATGETFSISGLKGKVVLVETLAMWCSNCLKQQGQVKELHSLLGERDDFVSIGIGVDPNEDIGMLAAYIDHNGFDWLYSVAPPEVLADIQRSLGGQFLNPPSTPIVLFDKDGNQHPLPFGIKSADELLSYVELYLN